MKRLAVTISLCWDGERLYVRPVFHSAWQELTGTPGDEYPWVTTFCTGIDDLTGFELGVFLANAVRSVSDEWIFERLTPPEDRGLVALFGPSLRSQVQEHEELDDRQD